MILSFLVGITDSTDAPPAKKTDLELLSKREVKFPDVDPESSDMTDYVSDDSDDDDSSSLEQHDQKNIWDEINKLTPLGSKQIWLSKPNVNVPLKKEPRFVGFICRR